MPRPGRDEWRRAGFELAIVFVGVLVALLVDGWNTRRMERGLERQYVNRLIQDVVGDTAALGDLLRTLDAKSQAIRWLQGKVPEEVRLGGDAREMARQLVLAQAVGFGVVRGNSTTFEDLRSTGNLSLIRDPVLRGRVVAYYETWSLDTRRVEARQTALPALVYSVLPPGAYDSDVSFDAPAPVLDGDLKLDLVASEILGDAGHRALRGELNYARFLRGVAQNLLIEAGTLLEVLGGTSKEKG